MTTQTDKKELGYRDLLEEAHVFSNKGEHKKAIELYKKASRKEWNCNEALMGLAGLHTWNGRFYEALDALVMSAARFPYEMPDYFVIKTRIKTRYVNTKDKALLNYTINALECMRKLLNNNFYATDFLSEMLMLQGDEKKAIELKYSATICNAAFSKKQDLSPFNDKEGKLPDFFVIGPQKTATTALYSFLIKSEDVYPSINKELFYFNGHSYEKGSAWYKSHFPNGAGNRKIITGEATATYFQSHAVPERMHKLVPDAKLIFTFRDPSKRAISSFFMEKRHGREPRNLYDTISKEIEFLRSNELRPGKPPKDFHTNNHSGYVLYGLYEHYLQNYKKYFSDEQIMIIQSEDLYTPQETVDSVCDFLGVKAPKIDNKKSVNVGEYDKNEEYFDTVKLLDQFYDDFKSYVLPE